MDFNQELDSMWEKDNRIAQLENQLSEAAMQSQAQQEPVCDVTFSQFLFDVHTAAGLVSHGKQCKALGDRLGKYVMKYRTQSQAQQTESQWMIPTESQILAATEKAGLWPNTVYTWLPAFHRYHAELAKLPPAPVSCNEQPEGE